MADAGGHSVDKYLKRNSTYGEVAVVPVTVVDQQGTHHQNDGSARKRERIRRLQKLRKLPA